jgi:catechol 2,3-dioxygenase-like lactoylglutathione lyase family enzyme
MVRNHHHIHHHPIHHHHLRAHATSALFFAVILLTKHAWTMSTTSSSKITSSSPFSLGGGTLRTLVTDAARHDIDMQETSSSLDLKGILWMEHINLVVGSPKSLAEYFYLEVLGCTRDAGKSFHVNLGQQQFHLAETNGDDRPQKIMGSVGLVVPSTLETLRGRIRIAAEGVLKDTQFGIIVNDDDQDNNHNCLTLRCPWGNIFHIYSVEDDDKLAKMPAPTETPRKMENMHAEGGAYGGHRMAVRGQPGIRYVEVACPKGTAPAVARFYRELLGCTVVLELPRNEAPSTALVCVGPGVHLAFVESPNTTNAVPFSDDDDAAANAMKGVHICFYAADFQGLYQRLSEKKLIWTNPRFLHLDSCDTWEEAWASRTLRFKDIIDLSTGEKILELEHETRPLRHGQYLKVPNYEPK